MLAGMGFPAKLLGPDERLVLLLRKHVKVLIGPVVVLLITVPAAALLAGLVPDGSAQPWMRLALAVVAAVIVARWVVWPFLVWWNTVYVITDRRLVLRRGVLNRSGHDMPLTRLNDVQFSHNVVERVLGCGTLVVESAGEVGQLVLDDIPRVEQVQRVLYQLSDELRTTGGDRAHRGGRPDEGDDADRDLDPFDDVHDDAHDDVHDNATKVLDRRRPRRPDR